MGDFIKTHRSGHFVDQAVENIKSGKTYRGTGDNWDMRILKSHMGKGNQNDDLHLFASNLIENRINFAKISNENPKCDITLLPRSKFSLDTTE